ncbi:MAG: hypothetical protein ABI824_13415 [Acidobacteriota bacterium]
MDFSFLPPSSQDVIKAAEYKAKVILQEARSNADKQAREYMRYGPGGIADQLAQEAKHTYAVGRHNAAVHLFEQAAHEIWLAMKSNIDSFELALQQLGAWVEGKYRPELEPVQKWIDVFVSDAYSHRAEQLKLSELSSQSAKHVSRDSDPVMGLNQPNAEFPTQPRAIESGGNESLTKQCLPSDEADVPQRSDHTAPAGLSGTVTRAYTDQAPTDTVEEPLKHSHDETQSALDAVSDFAPVSASRKAQLQAYKDKWSKSGHIVTDEVVAYNASPRLNDRTNVRRWASNNPRSTLAHDLKIRAALAKEPIFRGQ